MADRPIVRLPCGQYELAIRIVTPGCFGRQIVGTEGLYLMIRDVDCGECGLTTLHFEGCWAGHETPVTYYGCAPDRPALVYPAFDVTDDGEVLFRFDDRLSELPRGRYIGDIKLADGTCIRSLDIDLCSTTALISRVTLPVSVCGL